MVHCTLSHNECHKTHNGWYSGMVVPTYSIVGILILHNKNVPDLLSSSIYGGLVTVSAKF